MSAAMLSRLRALSNDRGHAARSDASPDPSSAKRPIALVILNEVKDLAAKRE
ncbi:MAG: hypothetical protein IT350_08315 [Deltaproteobacteria bacterium]|nr:hypothetical protein [Deltaproteobacteria bacterium]